MPTFRKGWDPARSAAARANIVASRRYARVAAAAPPPVPRPVSLSRYRRRKLVQGSAGTCWATAATFIAETVSGVRGYKAFDVCRRLVAWQGKQIEGGGNPDDGGSGFDALLAMTEEKGVGLGHEDLYPYGIDADTPTMTARRLLAQKPPDEVFADARLSHLLLPIVLKGLDDVLALLLAPDPLPSAIGVWCPDAWQTPRTFYGPDDVKGGEFGHEVVVNGCATPGVFDAYWWFEVENWWDDQYPALPPAKARLVPGYAETRPGFSPSFWVRRDALELIVARSNTANSTAEFSSAADAAGLAGPAIEAVSSESLF